MGLAGGAAAPASEPRQMRLVYVRETGAESCPDEGRVRAAVAGRLGYDPFSAAASATVVARITRENGRFFGSIEIVDESAGSRGNRELSTEGAECDEMSRAMALSISIAIDPEHAESDSSEGPRTDQTSTAVAPPSPSAASPARGALPPPRPDPRSTSDRPVNVERPDAGAGKPAFSSWLAAVSMLGVGTAPVFGGSLTLQARRGRWSLGAGGRLLSGPRGAAQGDTELRATLAAGELAGCFEHGPLSYCALGLAGATWARASSIAVPRTAVGAFGALGARVAAAAPLSRSFEAFAQAELLAVLSPIHPQIDGQDVWQAPPVAGGLGVGVRVRFW